MASESSQEKEGGGFNMSTASSSLATDSSSLVDLKAEVFRKQQEAQFNRIHGRNLTKESSSEGEKKEKVWSKKNAGVWKRSAQDAQEAAAERRRVQNALEEKARIYEQLQSGQARDDDGRFMVNFDRKDEDSDSVQNDGEEWVEYVDALGRSRVCMKSELADLKARDKDTFGNQGQETSEEQPGLMSEDMRRELLRQKWEQEEEENLRKTQLHYKDVLFDEARTHGAAFYNFARNESDRVSQQENLTSLHKETLKAREQKEKVKSKRQQALATRLKKVRDRKRLKMGLPILEDDEALEDEPQENVEEESLESTVMAGLKILRQEEEKQRDGKRKQIVREWDVGKDGVDAKEATGKDTIAEMMRRPVEKKVLSQQEWVDQKRTERQNEFAPPSIYEPSRGARGGRRGGETSSKYNNVPPPNSGGPKPSTSTAEFRSPKPCNSNERPPRLFNTSVPPPPMGANLSVPPPIAVPSTSKTNPMAQLNNQRTLHSTQEQIEEPAKKKMSLADRMQLHQEQFKPTPIVNQVGMNEHEQSESSSDDDDEEEEEEMQRPKRTEIAPPTSMDYYSNTNKRGANFRQGFRSHEQMAEAFLSGLKQTLNKNPDVDEDSEDE